MSESVNVYSTLSRPELLALCVDRGVPQYGTMAEIAARLAKRDAQAPASDDGADVEDLLGVSDTHAELIQAEPDEPAPSPATAPAEPQLTVTVDHPTNPLQFTAEFPVFGPPDDASHHRMLAQVIELARAAGHRTRGGGQRLRTINTPAGRVEVYAVSIRPNG